MPEHGAAQGRGNGAWGRRIVVVAALGAGTLAAAIGAGVGARVLTSPPTLVTGIAQAGSLVALLVGALLLMLGFALQGPDVPPPSRGTARHRRVSVTVIAVIVAGSAAVGWFG